ncbi:nidogen-like domain-containing protein [Hymenobacter bucti]|uniref:Nidogen-like domain-containing protein n=1 Tax=Hymenobacter bucti TaxID=1844114 RepID=A0ABW4QZ51_9BACT
MHTLATRWLCAALCVALTLTFGHVARAQQAPPAAPHVINPEDNDPDYAARKLLGAPKQTPTGRLAPAHKPAGAGTALARPACFEAIDTSATGNGVLLPRNDDGSFGPVALGWNFSLFGTVYNQVYINTNGNITFDAPLSTFSASGFPIGIPMVAPFWADVDTRGSGSGRIAYALYPDRLVVSWNRVGYFGSHFDRKNTFQLIIRANTAPSFTGNDILFAYDDMQWTTGDASSGTAGFGGVPATVGANRGNNINFIQTGRFNLNSAQAPNTPTVGTPGGVDFLDNQCLGYQVRGGGNVPPAVAGLPSGNTITVNQGQTQTVSLQFSGPETNQTVSVTPNLNGLCNATAAVTNNNTTNPTVVFAVTGGLCNTGTRTVTFTALDNGTPLPAQAVFTLTVVVNPPLGFSWTGAINTVYTNPGNWSTGTVPTATDDILIPVVPNLPVLSTLGTARTVTIASGASLTLGALGKLDLYGNLLNNGTCSGPGTLSTQGTAAQTLGGSNGIDIGSLLVGPSGASLTTTMTLAQLLSLTGSLTASANLTLLSTPTVTALVVNEGGVVIGSVTVQRAIDGTLNPGLGYRHYSSPVANATVADLATAGQSPVLNADYNTSPAPLSLAPFPTLFGYDQARLLLPNNAPAFDKGYFSPTAATDPLLVGRGYTLNIAASQLVDFVGTLNNGPYTLNLARNASDTPDAADAGWHLLGNPYPAPLDYSRVEAADRSNLEPAIYIVQSTSQYGSQYRAYTNGVGGNPVLPVGQGFFARVQAGQTSGALTFRNSQRLTTNNGTTFQRTAADTRPQVELALDGSAGLPDLLNVYFESGSTPGLDASYDARKLPNSTGLNLSSLTAKGEALAIDGRPLPTGQLTVPLQVRVPATGTYTLRAAQLKNLAGLHAYLHDVQLGTLTDLDQQASYRFALNGANTTSRFELVFSPQPLTTLAPATLSQEIALYPSPAQDVAFLELPARLGKQKLLVSLVDALGRQVRTYTLPTEGPVAHQLGLAGLRSGVYTVRLATATGVVIKRLVIE